VSWLVLIGVAVGTAGVVLALARAPKPSRTSNTLGADAGADGEAVKLAAQLIFVDTDHDRVTIDCVTACEAEIEDGEAVAVGTPFVLNAEMPLSAEWAVVAAEMVLDRWAETGQAIDMAFVRGARGLSVRLSDDVTRLQLALAA
jgi:hypothetical protein